MDDDFEEEIEIPIKQLEFDPPSRHDEGHIARIADSIAFTWMRGKAGCMPIFTSAKRRSACGSTNTIRPSPD